MSTLKNPLISRLHQETNSAKKKAREEEETRRGEEKNREIQNLQIQAKELFDSEVTEEKLFKFAQAGENKYPILFLESKRRHIVKNKKTGYKYNTGSKLGELLCGVLEENNFNPEIVEICDYHIEGLKKLIPDIKEGIYIGIKW